MERRFSIKMNDGDVEHLLAVFNHCLSLDDEDYYWFRDQFLDRLLAESKDELGRPITALSAILTLEHSGKN